MVEIALVGMALTTTLMSVGLAYVCLKNYPAISKSEVHRWVHEVHTEAAIEERDNEKVRLLAEKTAWETEGFTQQDIDQRPNDASDEEWDAALERGGISGVSPKVALREIREEASTFQPVI